MAEAPEIYEKRRQRLFLVLSGMFLGTVLVAVDLGYRFKRGDHGPGEIPLGSSLIGGARIAWNLNPHWSASLALSNGFDRIYRTSADEDAPLANERAAHLTLRWTP